MDNSGAILSPFVTTIWTEVELAAQADGEKAFAALENLLLNYYAPLKSHLRFKFQASDDEASDWLHKFLEHKVLLGEFLSKASRDRGRFRTFLLNSLDNFVRSEFRRTNAQKRVPRGGLLPLDGTRSDDVSLSVSEEDPFTVDWARSVVTEALKRMESETQERGHAERWQVFKARLLDPLLEGREPQGYEQLVGRLGFRSPAEASNTLMTAKRQFLRILHEVVADYVGPTGTVEEEIRELKRALAAG